MGRELHALLRSVFYTGSSAGNAPDRVFLSVVPACGSVRGSHPWFPPVVPTHISATKVNERFAHPLLDWDQVHPCGNHVPTLEHSLHRAALILSIASFSLSSTLSPLPMTNPSARSLVRLVRASLRLANDSVESLTTSQLLAIQHELRGALAIVDRKIKDNQRSPGGFSSNVRHG